MSKCSNCGAVIAEGNKYCPECGTKVGIENRVDSSRIEIAIDKYRRHEWLRGWLPAIIGLVIVIIGVWVGTTTAVTVRDSLWGGTSSTVSHPHGNIAIMLYVIGGLLTVSGVLLATYLRSKRASLEKRLNWRI